MPTPTPTPIPLVLSPRADGARHRSELSAVVQVGEALFLGSDEGTGIERLLPVDDGRAFGCHVSFPLAHHLDLPGDEDEELDVEGLGHADGWLWVVGSHSPRRKAPDADDPTDVKRRLRRLARVQRGGNRHLLARIPLTRDAGGAPAPARTLEGGVGATRHAARLPGGRRADTLTRAMRRDEHFAPFLDIPGKENGFNVEGLAIADERVFVGLRGPVLHGWSAVLGLEPHEDPDDPAALALRRIGRRKRRYTKHFLDLRGLGVRELHAHGDDLYVLAAPTMTLDGRATVLRWRGGCRAADDSIIDRRDLTPVLELPYGRGDAEHVDHPEGLAVVTIAGRRGVLVVYDAPARERQIGETGVVADFFEF